MRKTTFLGACALSGLACMSFAPQAQAQTLTLLHYKQSVTISLFGGSQSIDFQPFSTSLVGNANATLSSVQYTLTGLGSATGTLTNISGATKKFNFMGGGFASSTLALAGGATQSLNLLATGSRTFSVPNNQTQKYTFASVKTTADAGVLNNSGFTGSNPITGTLTSNSLGEFSGVNPSGLSASPGGTGTVTAKLTYNYYVPFTPVPELGTSISLGLMGLVGGALGLRARRRSK